MADKLLLKPAENYREDLLNNWPSQWPKKENHVVQHDIAAEQYLAFSDLIQAGAGERQIEKFFRANREVLSLVIWLFGTGHHMSWIFPKRQIRPPAGSTSGLIPDYLMAGADSLGVNWFVLELKGADKRAFVKRDKRVSLSADANAGASQLLNYIDLSSRDQAYLRDGLQLAGFREPRGILLIGTEDESEDPEVEGFKSAWNRNNPNVKIRSYSALLRTVEGKLRDFSRLSQG
jgi:hypothetical protein